MATTPRGIPLVGPDTIVNPISTPLNAMANALDGALTAMGNPAALTGTDAERLALTAPALRDGVTFLTTDTRLSWRRDGGVWKLTGGRPIVCQLTTSVAQGWSTSLVPFRWGGTPTTPIIDTDNFWNSAQNTRMTIPYKGHYQIEYGLYSNGVVPAYSGVYKNGSGTSTIVQGASVGSNGDGAGTAPRGSGILALNAGDFLEVKHFSPNTGTGNWSTPFCSFSATFLGEL